MDARSAARMDSPRPPCCHACVVVVHVLLRCCCPAMHACEHAPAPPPLTQPALTHVSCPVAMRVSLPCVSLRHACSSPMHACICTPTPPAPTHPQLGLSALLPVPFRDAYCTAAAAVAATSSKQQGRSQPARAMAEEISRPKVLGQESWGWTAPVSGNQELDTGRPVAARCWFAPPKATCTSGRIAPPSALCLQLSCSRCSDDIEGSGTCILQWALWWEVASLMHVLRRCTPHKQAARG